MNNPLTRALYSPAPPPQPNRRSYTVKIENNLSKMVYAITVDETEDLAPALRAGFEAVLKKVING